MTSASGNTDAATALHGGPLAGVRVLVTRTPAQAEPLSHALRGLGADVVAVPAIQIVPCPTPNLDAWLQAGDPVDWLVFTSSNAVDAFVARMDAAGRGPAKLLAERVAAIGAATAHRLQQAGFTVDLVPDDAVAESLAEALISVGVHGARLLLPVARAARDVLPERLRAAGAHVDVIPVYDTHIGIDPAHAARVQHVDIITVASPSAAAGVEALGDVWQRDPALVAIGPVTAARAQATGWQYIFTADDASVDGLVTAVCAAAQARLAAWHSTSTSSDTSASVGEGS